jgi:hypothetical protein
MLRALLFSLLLIANISFAAERTVIKNDGTVAHYQFLPVHHDPSHKAVVDKRLRLSVSGLPDSAAIATNVTPAVKDQGQRGTCAYFATVATLESYYMAQSATNTDPNLSEECLVDVRNWEFDQGAAYTGADDPSQRPDPNGDLPVSLILTVTADGVPVSGQYGTTNCVYDGLSSAAVAGPDVAMTDYLSAVAASGNFGKGLTFNVNTAPTVDAIRTLIASGVPVEVGIVVYNEYMDETDWRFDVKTDTADDIAGGHAVILTGYTTTSTGTIFTFKNSWGVTWGNAGFGTMDDKILSNSWGYDPSFDFIDSLPASSSK